ncbi:MAG: DUF262 domain-containing protein [Chloroflexi bacterium]|nr:DUF262 domain-containing protein [Chloroflexota bacterium]
MSKPDDRMTFDHLGIGDVLNRYRLALPVNQREFSWEEEHVRDLFSDLTGAIAEAGTYFLGTIVLTQGEGDEPEVSDGQQRLATITILLAAIRDYFHGRKDDTGAIAAAVPYGNRPEDDQRRSETAPERGRQ